MEEVLGPGLAGFVLSVIVGGLLSYYITPQTVISVTDRGRQFAAWVVLATTLTTLFRYYYPAPTGGTEAVIKWLVVSTSLGLISFVVGAAFQTVLNSLRKVRKDGPEMIGSAIRKSTDMAQRVQTALKTHVASNHSAPLHCENCQTTAEAGAVFCKNCGSRLPTSSTCTGCGAQLAPEHKYCDKCGQSNSKSRVVTAMK